MKHRQVELLGIGAGPSNLALAVALEELAPNTLAPDTLIIEQHENVEWQRGMLLPWAQSQVSFLKDLVTLRNPRSKFSFLNYLHSVGRLDDFVNLGSFIPYRREISDYLTWVSRSLNRVNIEFDRTCVRIEPVVSGFGKVDGWIAHLADGTTIGCRDLVVGAGRQPHVPAVFTGLPRQRVIHSTEFVQRFHDLRPDAHCRVAVIGGAQSAAEMLWTTHQQLPKSECTMIMRSIGLNNYESSKFTNELYYSSFIDDFHDARPEARNQLLREMHRSNYSGLAPGLLENLYRQIYLERLSGEERLSMMTMTEISGASVQGDELVLTLSNRRSGECRELRCDIVMLGTGFRRGMPPMLQSLARRVGLADVEVDRYYRLSLPNDSTANCYLQGVNEDTHGIADSLLSVLAGRSEEIVTDLIARRGSNELFTTAA